MAQHEPPHKEADPTPLVAGAPGQCCGCGAPLCLRKQVINLALGNVDEMWCLNCLGAQGGKSAGEVLGGVKAYICARECFGKEWRRYETVEYCPDRAGCRPDICFSEPDSGGE